jgi:probable rRNA maturation factor
LEIELSIQTDPQFRTKVDRAALVELIRRILSGEDTATPLSLALRVTDDETIRRLNLKYRGQDCVTDVLAFGMDQPDTGFVSPPSVPPHLGDIVVSYPRALAQSEELGHSVGQELNRLVVHGVLHLLGYDDQTDKERRTMWNRQEGILRDFEEDATTPQ